jgi:hypothetical protein
MKRSQAVLQVPKSPQLLLHSGPLIILRPHFVVTVHRVFDV